MCKKLLKNIYRILPLSIKFFAKDVYLYFTAKVKGGVSISSLVFSPTHEKVAVVGNGPSLKSDKLSFINISKDHDFICVNNFCDDDLYELVKPKLYLFLDAYFFSRHAHPDWVSRREKTFSIINKKTQWPMQIILPHTANSEILKEFIYNPNIKIVKLSTQSLFSTSYSKVTEWLFDSGFYGPPQINVLIYAIYLAIWSRYECVYIYGADLSFHKDIDVNQDNNDLYIKFKHFNEEDKVEVLRKNPEKIEKWRMAEFLRLSADTFLAHEIISEYSKEKRFLYITNPAIH